MCSLDPCQLYCGIGVVDMSHEKNPPTFHYTGWLIGILIMVYYNPYIPGQYNLLYTLNNQGFFHCSHGPSGIGVPH